MPLLPQVRLSVRASRRRRRRNIEAAADAMFKEEFSGRILAIDSATARPYAELVNDRRRRGRPISQFDSQIAAIARVAGASVATRKCRGLRAHGNQRHNNFIESPSTPLGAPICQTTALQRALDYFLILIVFLH
jgi:hypothetical protein